jgi:hypothetical protein
VCLCLCLCVCVCVYVCVCVCMRVMYCINASLSKTKLCFSNNNSDEKCEKPEKSAVATRKKMGQKLLCRLRDTH